MDVTFERCVKNGWNRGSIESDVFAERRRNKELSDKVHVSMVDVMKPAEQAKPAQQSK